MAGIPFTYTQSTAGATVALDDPFCLGPGGTVWFALTTTADMSIEANTLRSDYQTVLAVHTGPRGALTQIACNAFDLQPRVRFDAAAGATYLLMVSGGGVGSPGSQLVLNLVPGPPPLTVSVVMSGTASLDPTTGTATLHGTVTCSRPAFASVFGELRQVHARQPLTAFFFTSIPCDGATPWTATTESPLAPFHGRSAALFVGGPATASASTFAFDPDTGEVAGSSGTAGVILRGRR
jgi:hypothetical protein